MSSQSSSNHIKTSLQKLYSTLEEFKSKMTGEKHTEQVVSKLRELASVLKQCPFQNDEQISPSFVGVLWELNDNFKALSYYAEDHRKSNWIKRKKKASANRHKILQLLNALTNLTRLIETVSGVPELKDKMNEQVFLDGMIQVQSQGDCQKIDPAFEAQIMNKLASFEEKLASFSKWQRQQMMEDSTEQQSWAKEKRAVAKKSKPRQNSVEQDPVDTEIHIKPKENERAIQEIYQVQIEDEGPKLTKGQQACLEAYCMLYGHGIEPNIDNAVYWFNKSASLGEPRALLALGEMHEKGIGARINHSTATEYYQRAAQMDEPGAQLKLAKMFLKEFDANQDRLADLAASVSASITNENASVALKLFQNAAQSGHAEAQAVLGRIYEIGGYEDDQTGVFYPLTKRNTPKAIQLYTAAAESGNSLALNFLGAHHFNRLDNKKQGVKLFRRASISGTCSRALNNLGICFEIGVANTIKQDYQQALKLYEQSAKLGYPSAMVNRAYLTFKMAQRETNKMEQDNLYFDVAHWLRLALSRNDNIRDAHFLLGLLHEKGLGVDLSHKLAFEYYHQAMQLGHIKANTKVAHFYYSGVKYHTGDSLPMEVLETQASSENASYFIQPDKEIALTKYLRGSKLGDSEACNCAGLIVEATSPVEAVDYYKKALEADPFNSDAMFNMALLYLRSPEEKEWHQEAIEIIRRAASLGNCRAKDFLYKHGVSLSLNKVFVESEEIQRHFQATNISKGDQSKIDKNTSFHFNQSHYDETLSYQLTQSVAFDLTRVSVPTMHFKIEEGNIKPKEENTNVKDPSPKNDFDDTQGFNDRLIESMDPYF